MDTGQAKSRQNNRRLGSCYEQRAAEFLQKKGYEIVERNYRIRQGEIDLIARDGERLVFVEVKYRRNLKKGYPQEAVDKRKQRIIRQVAAHYLYCQGCGGEVPCRFDVVAFLEDQVCHIPDAF